MPLYTFACKKCQHSFDVRLTFNKADSEAPCPECGAGSKRRFTVPMAIIYKGKGWSSTTYEFGKDYFGLQKELKDVSARRERMKGSYEERLESQQNADERRDSERQTEKATSDSLERGEMPEAWSRAMDDGHGHGH